MSRTKLISFKLLLTMIICLATFVLLEIALRIYFSAKVDPEILLFGTPYCCGLAIGDVFDSKLQPQKQAKLQPRRQGPAGHHNVREGYSKYDSFEQKTDYVKPTGETINVMINKYGFRGED